MKFLQFFLVFVLASMVTTVYAKNKVGLVVQHENGVVQTQCIEFEEKTLTGFKVLERSGFDLKIEVNSKYGIAICSIDGEGCAYPKEKCFCNFQKYWSYWYIKDGDWKYSNKSASNRIVQSGDVEGFVWSASSMTPPKTSFIEICK